MIKVPKRKTMALAKVNWQSLLGPKRPIYRSPAFNSLIGAPPPPERGGGGGGSGAQAGILADYLNQMRADARAESNAQKGGMINNIRQAIISYGMAPDYANMSDDVKGYMKEALDPKTLELAKKAQDEGVSSNARLARENMIAMRRIPAQLAARGLLRSGQTGSDLGDQAQLFKNQGYDMLSALLQGITGSVSQYQEAERERQRQLAEMEMQAAMNAAGDWSDSDMGGGGPDNPNNPGGSTTNTGTPTNAAAAAARRAAAINRAKAAAAARARARNRVTYGYRPGRGRPYIGGGQY